MAFCSNCGNHVPDGATFCAACGTPIGAPAPVAPVVPVYDPTDHTAEFDPKDISDNKVFAMTPYLLGAIGIVVALLAAQKSDYVMFHVRQALKLSIVTLLLGLVTAVLCWTIIVPIVGGVCITIVTVLQIIAFFQVCGGKAKEPAIISKLSFLK